MNQESIRKDIFTFLRNPTFKESFDSNIKTNFIVLFKVLILTYIGLFVSAIPLAILEQFEIIRPIGMKTDKIYNFINENQSDYKLYFLLLVIVIYPIIEEISFRLPLTKFNSRILQFSVSIFSGHLITFLLKNMLWWPSTSLTNFLISIFYILAISSIVFIFLNYNKKWFHNLKIYWERKPNVIFYTSAVLFAVMHLLNLDLKISDLIYLPLILLPFFVYGISFGYLRIRIGFIYSIALHMLLNGIRFGITEFVKH